MDCEVTDFAPANSILTTYHLSFEVDSNVTSEEVEKEFEEVVSQNDYIIDNSIYNMTLKENGTSFDRKSYSSKLNIPPLITYLKDLCHGGGGLRCDRFRIS